MVVHDMKKAIGKMSKVEKVAMRKGDKSILYEKLGLVEQKDLDLYKSKFGIKAEQMGNEEELKDALEDKSILTARRQRSRYHRARE